MGAAAVGGHAPDMSNANIDSNIGNIGTALADAIAKVGPAVVHISADQRLASGTVWSAGDNLIVTTSRLFHEQRDAAIVIHTANGKRSGTLVGVDETTELALVRADVVEGAALSEAAWSDGARVGLFVAPVARTATGVRTTFGIVAQVGPGWVTARGGAVDAFIDVDGTLPPGFSGGPLIDFAGNVIGLNTRGLVPGGATLPTATVRRVVGHLASGQTTTPGHLGVAIQQVELPEHLRVDAAIASGLLVTGVVAGSAAADAGILVGDTLVAIDGAATSDHAHLLAALAGKAGTTVKVKIARHGQAIEVDAVPMARAERREHGHGHQHGHPHGHGHQHGHGPRNWWGRGCR